MPTVRRFLPLVATLALLALAGAAQADLCVAGLSVPLPPDQHVHVNC